MTQIEPRRDTSENLAAPYQPMDVCILTSGRGQRMGEMGTYLNKALVSVNHQAVISHIIENFPSDTRFVIGLGYKQKQVREYLNMAHPQGNFTFVTIDNFEGPGSGPGYSLLQCRKALPGPFYFVACDTLFNPESLLRSNASDWFGVVQAPVEQAKSYCNFSIDSSGRIVEIFDKTVAPGLTLYSFTGVCFIKNYETFWRCLQSADLTKGEHQISNGMRGLIELGSAYVQPMVWHDVGTLEGYNEAQAKEQRFDFSKPGEVLYLQKDRVIKFWKDPSILPKKMARAEHLKGLLPAIRETGEQFFSYTRAAGDTVYPQLSPDLFERLLSWLDQRLWSLPVNTSLHPDYKAAFRKFYETKTRERVDRYLQKLSFKTDVATIVLGEKIPPIHELLDRIDWGHLSEGQPAQTHGDLQFDNVIYDSTTDRFTLIDWRQDFGSITDFGDIYYDLAKLLGGIRLNYDYIKAGLFYYEETKKGVFYDFARRNATPIYDSILRNYVKRVGLDFHRVELITALIWINMAPLHGEPFDRLLFSLGKHSLWHHLQSS